MSANDTVGSPTTNTQETITDIIAAKRSEADSIEQSARGSFKVGYSWDDLPFTEGDLERALDNAAHIRKEADRLEEALKRELESMSGNVAAMREALETLLNLAYEVQDANSECGPRVCITAQFIIDEAKSALTAPPRNCDVLFLDRVEMYGAFKDWCNAKGHTMEPKLAYDAFDWLLALATKGGAKWEVK